MASAVVFRSFHGAPHSAANAQIFLEKPADASRRCLSFQASVQCRRRPHFISKSTLTSDASGSAPQGPSEVKDVHKSTLPNGFEALVLGVCDETDIAELKLKVGQFEMHLKRDIGSPVVSNPIALPASLPPVPSKPKVESGPAATQATPQKSTSASNSPFANISSGKAPKLAALEASGSNTHVLVSSPAVGLFRTGRTLKGKKQPSSCKEGDMIKEGQIIGFLDQFGSELPIKSDAAGEVVKVLYKDGEPVGYGDALVALLPSFRGIK